VKLDVYRDPVAGDTTFGRLLVDGQAECLTLEDELREVPGVPVGEWKVHGETAIPAGTYELAVRDSPKFGPDTLWVTGVPGFHYILIHSGSDVDSTEGCIVVGDQVKREAGTIHGGKLRGVLQALKDKVVPRIKAGELVLIQVHNPPGYAGPNEQEPVA
jgi:hypothetical protein